MTARRRLSGDTDERIDNADLGPMPCTLMRVSNNVRCSSDAKPYRISASSRTTRCVYRKATLPTSTVSKTEPGTETLIPTPPTSITRESVVVCKTRPRREEIMRKQLGAQQTEFETIGHFIIV